MSSLLDIIINGPARFTQDHGFGNGSALLFILFFLILEIGAAALVCRLAWYIAVNARGVTALVLQRFGVGRPDIPYTLLALTFPSKTTKSAFATEQLHTLLRSLVTSDPEEDGSDSRWAKLAAWKRPYSLEIVASKDEGIIYTIRIPSAQAEIIQRTILSFLPGAKIHEMADDYLTEIDGGNSRALELQLSGDYVLPLGDNSAISEHDMITYLTGHMRSLDPEERVVYQLVVAPVFAQTHQLISRRVGQFHHRLAARHELLSHLRGSEEQQRERRTWTILLPVTAFITGLRFIRGACRMIKTRGGSLSPSTHVIPAGEESPIELELRERIKQKLDQPLFEVSVRILVISPDSQRSRARLSSLVSSFETLSHAAQAMTVRPQRTRGVDQVDQLLGRTQTRALSDHLLSPPMILSSAELSDLYHFPHTGLTKTEDLVKSRSRELPAPLSMKHETSEFDVVMGMNNFGGHTQRVGLTRAQRQKHVYVIGKTGTGKTTLLTSAITQDMENGKGIAVLDPHGDMFHELLSLVPEHRLKDVVVFDPSDRDFPVGFNILSPGIEFSSEEDGHEWITSAVISVFAKLADKSQWGPKMEHILRSATLTALQTPKPTLFTIQRLLTDKSYRTSVARTLKDPVLRQFWDKEFKLMGDMQVSSAVSPITHRLGHFLTSTMSRNILLQEESTIQMSDIMNEGKILLVNLSKGDIGEDQSFFFGTLLTSAMWMAAYQRTKIPEKERRDFYVYVDEFQNFATPQFGDIMSEGRKFHIALTVSHQNMAQIDDLNLVKVVTGNAGTLISLKVSPQDEAFLLPYFQPEVERGDIVNLPPYHFYMKVTGEETEDAFSGQTVPVEVRQTQDMDIAVIEESRGRYGMAKATVARRIAKLMPEDEATEDTASVQVLRVSEQSRKAKIPKGT